MAAPGPGKPASKDRLVQIASYNTNLQGLVGLPQDLVDWLSPTLQVSNFLSGQTRAPDIVAVGFQELLPLHLGLSGLSKSVIDERDTHIRSQIELNAPDKEAYSLVAKVVNVGVALFVYAQDAGLAQKICDVQTRWAGSGPGYMGNKGAVGVRFRVTGDDGGVGETFTFVCAHLTAHEHKLAQRIADYHHIVGTLLFPPTSTTGTFTNMYATSHLFFLGDLNFRLSLPSVHALSSSLKASGFAKVLESENNREQLKEFDQLTIEKRKGNAFIGLREGEFWKFKCSYKYKLGEVDKYSVARTPAWTDRILYTTYTDSPETPDRSNIKNLLYTSIPSYTTSDHKPIVSVLLVPPPSTTPTSRIPLLCLPTHYTPTPDPCANLKRYSGRILDRIIGSIWWFLTLFGAGSAIFGIFNCLVGLGAWKWWKSATLTASSV